MKFQGAALIGTVYKASGILVFVFGLFVSLLTLYFGNDGYSFLFSVVMAFFAGLSVYAVGEAFVIARHIAMSVRLLALQEGKPNIGRPRKKSLRGK